MALVSFILGQKYYPIPYETLKVCAYIALVVLLYEIFAHSTNSVSYGLKYLTATVFMLLFSAFVYIVDGKTLPKLLRS
jgi:hypothetical protein